MARKLLLALAVFLALASFIGFAAMAQIEARDLGYQAKPLNPGVTAPACAAGSALTWNDAALVMKVEIRDVDYPAQDRSNVKITHIQVSNLGTAEVGAVKDIIFLDKDNRCIDTLWPITAWGETRNIPDWEIADEGTQILQVVVFLDDTDHLAGVFQGKTLRLQLRLTYEEQPSGFSTPQTFTSPGIEDKAPEIIWNGGFEAAVDNNYSGGILTLGGTHKVQEFTLCDNDAQLSRPVLREVWVVNLGDADEYDLAEIHLYVKGNPTPIATIQIPATPFTPGTPVRITPVGFGYTFTDDTCATFQIGVKVSPYAFPGHTVQFETTVVAEEPNGTEIDSSVWPKMSDGTPEAIVTGPAIPAGMDAIIIHNPNLPANAEGFVTIRWKSHDPAVGLGGIQGTLIWNPNVIDPIDDPHNPADDETPFVVLPPYNDDYTISSATINHLEGRATFTLSYNFGLTSVPVIDGDIFKFKVNGVGAVGDQTQLELSLVEVLDDASPPNNITANVFVCPGPITLVILGDVDGSGRITIHDALLVAQHLVGLLTLTAEQLLIADATQDGTVDSADVAEIARKAITAEAASAAAEALGKATSPTELQIRAVALSSSSGTLGFRVEGQGIAAAKVEIYSLSGKRLFDSGFAAGTSLEWNMRTAQGALLANGVYLYVVTVRGYNGELATTGVRKLVILR
ncbi:MAG: dockerin type I domain-containing protein [Candidatus Acetothermia bacterium]|nr:dockerin type I domain-containing protein [Candidatus Acetothermia bacterium]MDH7506000.1 dockerin type I repeat-containing protein [Candidatus Acetothermia bacterium]